MIEQWSHQLVLSYPTFSSYLNGHILYDIFVFSGLSIIELLRIWPTVKFRSNTEPFISNMLSSTLLSFFLALNFSLCCSFPCIVFTSYLPYKSVNFQLQVSLFKLISSNQTLPHFGWLHTTASVSLS